MELNELQPDLLRRFNHILQTGHMSHAYLFSGEFGAMEMAVYLAQSRFCEQLKDSLPCGECRSCQLIREHEFADLKIIEPEGQVIKTETIRELTKDFSRSGFEGEAQVFIVKEADKMHQNAANSLLKMIEEPQSQTYIILLTADENRMLQTIKSRCQVFRFLKNTNYLEELLLKEGLLPRPAKLLAAVSNSPEEALILAQDKKIIDLCATIEQFTKTLLKQETTTYLEVARLASVANDKSTQAFSFNLLIFLLEASQRPSLLSQLYQAYQMWLANVSFQNALEYFVLAQTK